MRSIGVDLSIESIPDPHERQAVNDAHKAYHRRTEEEPLPVTTAMELGRTLSRSPDLDHQLDSGWLHMAAGISLPATERAQQLALAKSAWETVAELGESPADKLKAKLDLTYLPAFDEVTRKGKANVQELVQRLANINRRIVESVTNTAMDVKIRGLAAEVAVISLLLRHYRKTDPTGQTDIKVWPASSRADRTWGEPVVPSANFDVACGSFPTISDRLQIKSWLSREELEEDLGTKDPEKLLEYWRAHYRQDITIIFSETHLMAGEKGHYYANHMLAAKPNSSKAKRQRSAALDMMATNILEEIAKTDRQIAEKEAV